MRNYQVDTLYKIGTDPSKLTTLKNLGLAAPDQVTYQAASVYTIRADMSRVGDGYSIAAWIWDVISIDRLSKLLEYLEGADYVNLYIRTDIRDGTHAVAANAFKVFSAVMWKPLLFGQDGNPIVRSPYAMQSVKLQFVNLVEVAGYL
ncbi:MAG: hypothetical protein WC479_00550 [Candidatus Izemoplasmatales bacterium]